MPTCMLLSTGRQRFVEHYWITQKPLTGARPFSCKVSKMGYMKLPEILQTPDVFIWSHTATKHSFIQVYPPPLLKSDILHFRILSPSHATLLNETWSIGGNNRSLRYLESLINYFPNACLMDKEGQLVSWTLSDPLACLTHGYTIPQYRGQGCSELVTLATAEKLHAHGFPIYAGTLPDNQAALQTLRRQGFHFLPWTKYVLLITPPI